MKTHLDLFSGIGGFALAAEAAGLQTIGFSEIEPYACKILKRHWPDVPNYGDIRNIKSVCADLITGGFPCQPYSLAGKRRGKEDDRHLWPEMCRVIAESKPAWVLGENVPGIIGLELDSVLADLERLDYACQAFVIPACAVDARHRRDRVWIVANANGGQHECGGTQPNQRTIPRGDGEENGALADTESQRERSKPALPGKGIRTFGDSETISNPRRLGGASGITNSQAGKEGNAAIVDDYREIISHNGCGCGQRRGREIGGEPQPARWLPEPELGRVADGIPNRAHRLRRLGNAIVPQIAEVLIREMVRMENGELKHGEEAK